MLKAKHAFKMFFMIIRFELFNDNLNIVLILAPTCDFFSTK